MDSLAGRRERDDKSCFPGVKEEQFFVVFLSKSVDNDWLNRLRNSVQSVVEQKNYNWQVARVSAGGKIEITDK
jgi:SRSO17 transposase